MNIDQLYYLTMVAQTKSITIAAENLFVTQQTISKSINKLEIELGGKLLNRTHKGVSLTPKGEKFVEHANNIIREFEQLKFDMESLENEEYKGDIEFLGSSYICFTVLPNLLTQYYQKYPNINIRVKEVLTYDVINAILNGRVNLGIITTLSERIQEDFIDIYGEELEYEELFSDDLIVFVSKNHQLAKQKEVSLKEAVSYPLVLSDSPGFEDILEIKYKIKPKVLISSSNCATHGKAVEQGLAVGFTTPLVRKHSDYGHMEHIKYLPVDRDIKLSTLLIKPKGYELTSIEKLIVDNIKETTV